MARWWRSNEAFLHTLFILFLGQVVSFMVALMSFTSSLLSNLGVYVPLTLSFFTYLTITLVYGSIFLYRRQKLMVSWYWYVLLGFIDVQGNYLGGSKPLLGDTLVIAGTLFFAMSNVGEEFCVKKKDRVEVVSMVGLFGLIVSVCQISILERKSLESVNWSAEIILALVGYAVSSFTLYFLIPFVLKMSGSTMYSLSVLTSDMWAVVIRIFFYHQQVDWLYYLSFVIVVLGLIIYSKIEKNPAPEPLIENGNLNAQYQLLDDESAGPETRLWLCEEKSYS